MKNLKKLNYFSLQLTIFFRCAPIRGNCPGDHNCKAGPGHWRWTIGNQQRPATNEHHWPIRGGIDSDDPTKSGLVLWAFCIVPSLRKRRQN